MGQTIIFGLAPFPLIDGDKPVPAPQKGEGFLAAKRVLPATHPPPPQLLPRAPPPLPKEAHGSSKLRPEDA